VSDLTARQQATAAIAAFTAAGRERAGPSAADRAGTVLDKLLANQH
jgi:hypothetical protein